MKRLSLTLLVLSLATCHADPAAAGNCGFLEQFNENNLLLVPNSGFLPQFNKNNYFTKINSQNLLDVVAVEGYSGVLSKPTSVTPQRHCGFFAPEIRPASQAGFDNGASAAASHLRLQSVYDGMTRQNTTPFTGNMPGGSSRPRVNPVTHSGAQPEWANTQKLLGAAVMAQNNNRAQVASVNSFSAQYVSPDTFFAPQPDADSASAQDSAYALLDMAQASVVALMASGEDEKEGFTLNHKLVISLLWSIDTHIGLAKAALSHMSKVEHAAWTADQAAKAGGAA